MKEKKEGIKREWREGAKEGNRNMRIRKTPSLPGEGEQHGKKPIDKISCEFIKVSTFRQHDHLGRWWF